MRHWLIIVISIVALLCPTRSVAQPDAIVKVKQLTVDDGLSHNSVYTIHQDAQGFMWLGTEYGVNRYNGHQYQWLTKAQDGLTDNLVQAIHPEGDRYLWLHSKRHHTLSLVDAQRVKVVPLEERFGEAMPFEADKVMAVYRCPSGNNIAVRTTENRIFRLVGDAWRTVTLPLSFEPMCLTDAQTYWGQLGDDVVEVDSLGSELQRFKGAAYGGHYRQLQAIDDALVWGVLSYPKATPGEFMIRLVRIRQGVVELLEWSPGIDPETTPYLQATNGDVMLRTIFEGYRLDASGSPERILTHAQLGQGININTIYRDRQGTHWVGTFAGAFMADRRWSPFTTYGSELRFGNFEHYPTRALVAYDSVLYVMSRAMPIRVDLTDGSYRELPEALNEAGAKPFAATKALDGSLIVGTRELKVLDSISGRVRQIYTHPEKVRYDGRYYTIFQSGDGTIWVGGSDGLHFIRPEVDKHLRRFDRYNGHDELGNSDIYHILPDGESLWVSTTEGLYLVHPVRGVLSRYSTRDEGDRYLPSDDFRYCYRDSSGILYLATQDVGLLAFYPNQPDRVRAQLRLLDATEARPLAKYPHYRQLDRTHGLLSNDHYCIYPDERGYLWVSTSRGLIFLDKQTFDFRIYLAEDGLTVSEFNRLSYARDRRSGRIFFGGLNGVNAFYPEDFDFDEPYAPELTISRVQFLGFRGDALDDMTGKHPELRTVRFRSSTQLGVLTLSLQDYINSEEVRYEYRIDGYNSRWIALEGNQLQLSGINPGRYGLRVRARGENGQYSSQQLDIRLIVEAPFWSTWWFWAVLVGLGAGSVWLGYYWRTKRMRKRQLELESQVASRTRQIEQDKNIIEAQAARLMQLNATKSRFFTNISHELRTPLTLILGPVESILNNSELDHRQATYLNMVHQNAELLLKRINDLLGLSKLTSGDLQMTTETAAVRPWVAELIFSYQELARTSGIELQADRLPDEDLLATFDTDKTAQILGNFMSNALKFTPAGGQVRISVVRESDKLLLSVADTGKGIPEEEQELIFTRFYQQVEHTHQGSGVGLSLSRELAQLMGGRVYARSTVGEGSTFYLELPYALVQETPEDEMMSIVAESVPAAVSGQIIDQPRILIVEDNPALRNYVALVMEEYDIVTAEHGKAALDWLESHPEQPVSLIITDLMMPEMDGTELVEHLRRREAYRGIPIIVLTARQDVNTKIQSLRIGVDDYLTKPFSEEELQVRAANLLRRYRSRVQARQEVVMAVDTPEADTDDDATSELDLEWLAQVEQALRDSIDDPKYKLSSLAYDLNVSERRFQQRVKALTGLTPKQYQREIRLDTARQLLESGTYATVSEVSYRVGFMNQHYFSKLYYERYGKKPSGYF